MARQYKQPSLVSGMTVQDILTMDNRTFNSLKEADLRKVVGRLVSAGNKRMRTFEKKGATSPAVSAASKSGGKFSTKGKSFGELRSEYLRAKQFLQAKTSTVAGWNRTKKELAEKMQAAGADVTPGQLDDVLKTYDRLKQIDPTVESKGMKYRLISDIAQLDESMPIDEKMNQMLQRIDEIYEEEAESYYEAGGVSEFFNLD